MRRFWLGFAIAVVLVSAGEFAYVRLGFVDPRADVPENTVEKDIAMPSLDASVDRHAPDMRNPVPPTNQNLIAGMKVYQANCTSCHGDIQRPEGIFAHALYPRAPQFVEDAPDMPESQNFYIIEHGVRLSGMPAWNKVLNQQETWQVTTFLSHMDKLPPEVSAQWKALAGSGAEPSKQ